MYSVVFLLFHACGDLNKATEKLCTYEYIIIFITIIIIVRANDSLILQSDDDEDEKEGGIIQAKIGRRNECIKNVNQGRMKSFFFCCEKNV